MVSAPRIDAFSRSNGLAKGKTAGKRIGGAKNRSPSGLPSSTSPVRGLGQIDFGINFRQRQMAMNCVERQAVRQRLTLAEQPRVDRLVFADLSCEHFDRTAIL